MNKNKEVFSKSLIESIFQAIYFCVFITVIVFFIIEYIFIDYKDKLQFLGALSEKPIFQSFFIAYISSITTFMFLAILNKFNKKL